MNISKTQGPRSWVIYALSDPRTPEAVRYVGVTHATPRNRLARHLSNARNPRVPTHSSHWIMSLLMCGVTPSIRVIDSGRGLGWEASEMYWIAWHKEHGSDLTNHTSGGEGAVGRPCSPETRTKLSTARRRRVTSPETIVKMSAAAKGKKHSQETLAKMSASSRGKRHSPEALAKISAASRGRKFSAESCSKMSASHLGSKQSSEALAKSANARRGQKRGHQALANITEANRRGGNQIQESTDRSPHGRIRQEKSGGPRE